MAISELGYNTDYIHGIKSREKINELVAQVNLTSNYGTEGVFEEFTTQSGSPEDVPKTVLYGTNKDSDNGHVTYLNGVFTINTAGFYAIKSRIRSGRTGASGSSNLFFWAEGRADSGDAWAITGASVDVLLDSSNDNKIFFDFSTLFLSAGFQLRSRFSRSSTGNDSGDLVPSVPSSALVTVGVNPTPSAQVTIYKSA